MNLLYNVTLFLLATQTMYHTGEKVNLPSKVSCCLDGILFKLLLALVSSDDGNGSKYS